MKFEEFQLERNQSLFENEVDYNLSESGVHPLKLSEILNEEEQEQILDTGLFYGYTNGTPQLRKRIADIYGADFTINNVLITSGSAEANFLSVMTQLERGDEIVYMVPNYLQIYHLARSFGIKVKNLPIRQELGWQWDIDELRNLVSAKTKMIAVCNPNNPTGAIMSDAVMDGALIAAAALPQSITTFIGFSMVIFSVIILLYSFKILYRASVPSPSSKSFLSISLYNV